MVSLAELRELVVGVARDLDSALVSPAAAMVALRQVSAARRALVALEAQLSARAAEGDGWRQAGSASAAEWLARTTGITAASARDQIACGRRLRHLDATRVVAIEGQLSAEQLAAITDAATAAPDCEVELLAAADRDSLGELRDRCLQVKARADDHPELTRSRVHRRRGTRTWIDKEGAFNLHVRTTVDQGAPIDAELERLTQTQFKAAHAEGRRESREAYKTDALAEMAERSRNGTANEDERPPIRYLAVLRADLSALARGEVGDGEICEIAGLGPIPVTVARDLLGESVLKLVLTRGRDANVTHLGRGPNAAQRITLLWRSPICQAEGCGRRARLEFDHTEDYAVTGHTTLEELEPLCRQDHDLKTRLGWALVPGIGKRPFVPPDDHRHPRLNHRQQKAPPDREAACPSTLAHAH